MSVSNIIGNVENYSQQPEWDILADHKGIKIDQKFVLNLTKGRKNVNKEVKDSCKILHFSSEWNFDEVLAKIDGLDPNEFPQLFIFITKTNNIAANQEELSRKSAKLQEELLKFGGTRPMILQLTSEDKKITKIYNKDETAVNFLEINPKPDESEKLNTFSSFLRSFLNKKFDNLEEEAFNALSLLSDRSLALRFLRSLNLSDGFFGALALDLASGGTKVEFLSALDAPFDSNGRILGNRAQQYIFDVFWDDDDPENDDSVLLKAIKNNNKEVIDYLITYWTHLIQQLPFKHQVIISTTAFDTNQLDVLCDLLDIADYPFPKNLKPGIVKHERLCKISGERIDFKAAIKTENFEKIDEFINNNRNLKFIYNHENNSALTEAINLKKFAVFYYLKSHGCRGENCDDILQKLNKEEKEEAIKQATKQRRINVQKAKINTNNSVLKMSTISLIHNSKISKEEDAKYRRHIMKWFVDIHKVAPELIDVAASCEHLKIIFDFESDSVENMSLKGAASLGSMYSLRKWIFVGAKLSDRYGNVTKQHEQEIKGVLAHELCHYVMRLVYENNENPYYKHMIRDRELFEAIVKNIDKWSEEDSECPDDECNGIISSVFRLYFPKDFHPELIVRIVQILAEFDNNDEHVRHLQHKYRSFFVFWETIVIPELQKFINENRDGVRKINETFGLLKDYEDNNIKLSLSSDLSILDSNQLVIITTNIPKLLIINICSHLQQKFGNQLDTQNIFVNPKKLRNEKMLSNLRSIISENAKLNIFVDCSKDVDIDWNSIKFREDSKLVFIVSNESQLKNMRDRNKNVAVTKIDYNWSHLNEESQALLLETKINFQNSSGLTLLDLFKKDINPVEPATSKHCKKEDIGFLKMCYKIVDYQLLNVLLDRSQTLIIKPSQDNENEKWIELLFQPRKFIKNRNEKNSNSNSKISQEELLMEVKNQKYVLIADPAGNGKSWAMKNFSKILREQNPTRWVTYVDLKQFIDEFRAKNVELEFSAFMIKKVLKLKQNFEAEIFEKMYKNGKIFVFFDGFDEIAPNCAEFVSKLAQNFNSNGGNQLWIATRDYFEVDLKKKLKLDVAYKLDEMTEKEGVDLIARSWVFMSLKGKNELKSNEEFEECIKMSSNFKSYEEKARQLVEKALISRNYSVGLPQLFKMIADGFKDEDNLEDIQGSKIYVKFIDILYIRWSRKKGQIREEADVKSQRFELNFYKFHQYHAVLSMFPELAKTLFPGYNGSEWPQEEIIACGILTIIDGQVYFIHETFREFFVADAIVNSIKKPTIDENVVDLFVEVSTTKKFGIIRMFLNDTIDDSLLFELVSVIVRSLNYIKTFNIFYNNINREIFGLSNLKKFLKFQKYFVNFLNTENLKNLIFLKNSFCTIIESSLEIEIVEDFVTKTELKTDREFVRKGLMLVSNDDKKENIFYFLSTSTNLNAQKVQKFLKIMDKFFSVTEIFELMSKCNGKEQNILQICVLKKIKENLKILWNEIEKYFTNVNCPQNFKEFVKQTDIDKDNVLHSVSSGYNVDVQETFWELLLKTFKDREELKDFILQKNQKKNNFVHELVSENKNPAIIEWTFKFLKENFIKAQFQEILKSKGECGRSLLQTAAWNLNSIEVHKFLWKYFRNFCQTDEKFLQMLKEVNELNHNILHNTAYWSSSEVFDFMIQELEKIASPDEIRQMLWNFDKFSVLRLLNIAVEWNKSPEFHKTLWKTLRKYFKKSEILRFIKKVDKDGNNLLSTAVKRNTKEIVELTWNEIKTFLNHEEQVKFLVIKRNDGKNLLECSSENKKHKEEVHDWIENLMDDYGITYGL